MDLEWVGNTPRQVEVGDRIELLNMPDDPDPVKPGTTGTVTSVDTRMDVVGVKWDDGRTLNLVLGVDSFHILNEGASDKAIINKSMPKPTLRGKEVSKMRTQMNKTFKTQLSKAKDKDIKVESDQVEGGKADKLSPSDIAKKHGVKLKDIQKEIEMGVEIEMEHTDDPSLAKEITLDHLTEFPDYYSNKKYGLKASEKKLEKVHENFFGGLGNAFGKKKNKDDQYDNKKLGDDLKRIMDVMKTSGFQHKDTIQNMIENFREKYSEHSRIGDMMKSLYYELDQLGELEETTGAGSSGAFSGPLFGGPQKRNESRVIKVRDLLEGTTTFNTDNTDGSAPFDGNTFVDMDGDGWNFDDVTAWEGGEIVDILAKKKNINWKDDNLNMTGKITKESLIKRITESEEEELDETTTATSSGQYSTPMFAAKSDKDWKTSKKPIWKGGQIIQKVKNSGVLSEINKQKYHKDGKYVKLKDTCVKYKNQPWCSQGDIDKPLVLSKTTNESISEVAKKLGISEEEVKKVVINRLSR